MPFRYSPSARFLHWLTAAIVTTIVVAGIWVVYFEPKNNDTLANMLWLVHENGGVMLFAVVLIRVLVRLTHPPAPLPEDMSPLLGLAARANHVFLYALLLAEPVVGFLNSNAAGSPVMLLGRIQLPSPIGKDDALSPALSALHWYIAMALLALIAAHLVGAAYHGLVRRDGVAGRMV